MRNPLLRKHKMRTSKSKSLLKISINPREYVNCRPFITLFAVVNIFSVNVRRYMRSRTDNRYTRETTRANDNLYTIYITTRLHAFIILPIYKKPTTPTELASHSS